MAPDTPVAPSAEPKDTRGRRWPRLLLLLALAALLVLVAILLWQRQQLRVLSLQPERDASGVSTLSPIRIRFSHGMDAEHTPDIALQAGDGEPVAGAVAWQGNTLVFTPAAPLQPETGYSVTVAGGSRSTDGESLAEPLQWQFQTAPLRFLYLGWDDENQTQLFRAPMGAGATAEEPALQLTESDQGVLEYALSPDGQTIAYTARRATGGSDLWAVERDGGDERRLLDCGGEQCSAPVWAPDGLRLLYERRSPSPQGTLDQPRLWWLNPANGETLPLFADEGALGFGARFSADSEWLAYVLPEPREIRAVNLESGESFLFPSETGEAPAWHPAALRFLFTDIRVSSGEALVTHIFEAGLSNREVENISGDVEMNDNAPAWSPDGESVAFARQLPRTALGRQIWLMSASGAGQTALTSDPQRNFTRPLWSPDGEELLVQVYPLGAAQGARDEQPAVWLLDLNGEATELASPATQPAWLP